MIVIEDIHFHHAHSETAVLNGVGFSASEGTLTAIVGPNGSGKTTLFNCIAGLWPYQKGDILFRGATLRHYSHSQRARIIAVVPQEHEPPFPYSVFDAVLVGRAAHVGMFSTPSPKDYLIAEEVMQQVGIAHLRDRPYTKISGGERQLALIARSLAQESPVMLLDEPTSHLDFRNQALVLKKLTNIVRQKSVIALMTIHDPNLAMLFADKVVMINNGVVIAQGAPYDVLNEDNLAEVYGINVAVISHEGSRVIAPKL